MGAFQFCNAWATRLFMLAITSLGQAASQPSLTVVEPVSDSYAVGPVRLLVDVQPATTRVARVEFFVDGVWVCRAERTPFECTWDAGTGRTAREILAVATVEGGVRLTHRVRTKALEYSESVGVKSVLVPVVVTDDRGRFVRNLPQKDFRVTEDGTEQTLTHFEAENAPLDLVVAIDISDSMRRTMPALKKAVLQFVNSMRPGDRVTLVAFNDRVFVLSRGESDVAVRTAALESVVARGGTALYDAVVQSLNLLEPGLTRKAVVVFTDGADLSSQASLEPVEQRVRESDAALYIITQGKQSNVGRVRRAMEQLAKISGGRAFAADDVDDLGKALSYVRDDLAHQYLLGYSPSNSALDGNYRRIAVEIQNGRYKIRAREGYRANDRR